MDEHASGNSGELDPQSRCEAIARKLLAALPASVGSWRWCNGQWRESQWTAWSREVESRGDELLAWRDNAGRCRLAAAAAPELTRIWLRRMLGGDDSGAPRHPLSRLERTLLKPVLGEALHTIAPQLQGDLECESDVDALSPPAESDWLLVVSAEVHDASCEPPSTGHAVSIAVAWSWRDAVTRVVERVDQHLFEACAGERLLQAHWPAVSLPASLLADLEVGDVIDFELALDTPLQVRLDGQPHGVAEPGVYRGRRAIQVISEAIPISPQ